MNLPAFVRTITWGLLLVTATMTNAAMAQDDATRSAARSVGYEGVQAYQQGDYAVAVDKLGRAFDIVKVPTLGLWYARALVQRGKLVEASERYAEVVHLDVTSGKLKDQREAQAEAAEEHEALQKRLPRLTILVKGKTEGLELSIDDALISLSLLGVARPLNPGEHIITAKRGDRKHTQTVRIAESRSETIELDLSSLEGISTQVLPANPGALPARATRVESHPPAPPQKKSIQPILAYSALGLGTAATVVGVVAGVVTRSKKRALDDSGNCEGSQCLPSERDTLDSYNTMRTTSIVGLVVGAAGIGAGVTLLLTAPKTTESRASLQAGLGGVSIRGAF